MKLKKKVKIILILFIIVILAIFGYLLYQNISNSKGTKEQKVVSEIKDYGYKLKDTKSKTYKEMFAELKKILDSKNVNEEEYLKQISKMFIYDFYSLKDKAAKTDVGGTDFVYSEVLDNFLLNAQDTYYKYVESNIYYAYNDKTDEKAYTVKVTWNYTSNEFSDYQKSATLVFIHDGKKLCLVELQ